MGFLRLLAVNNVKPLFIIILHYILLGFYNIQINYKKPFAEFLSNKRPVHLYFAKNQIIINNTGNNLIKTWGNVLLFNLNIFANNSLL